MQRCDGIPGSRFTGGYKFRFIQLLYLDLCWLCRKVTKETSSDSDSIAIVLYCSVTPTLHPAQDSHLHLFRLLQPSWESKLDCVNVSLHPKGNMYECETDTTHRDRLVTDCRPISTLNMKVFQEAYQPRSLVPILPSWLVLPGSWGLFKCIMGCVPSAQWDRTPVNRQANTTESIALTWKVRFSPLPGTSLEQISSVGTPE